MSSSKHDLNSDSTDAATVAYRPGASKGSDDKRVEGTQASSAARTTVQGDPLELSYAEVYPRETPVELTRLVDGAVLSEFKILSVLGRGGMGVVYEAIELALNRKVALKVLPSTALLDAQQIARFKNEARAVAQLNHDNIVPVYRVGSEQSIHYYAMQLIHGQNLAQVVMYIADYVAQDQHRAEGDTRRKGSTRTQEGSQGGKAGTVDRGSRHHRISAENFAAVRSSRRGASAMSKELFESVALLGAEIADGLAHAHNHGVIHRDIKPSNIMVDENGKPWITDFGLAQVRDTPNATRTGDVLGTLRYMSPEQASGRRFLVDHRTDIYSLGVTLYELVTLRKPFEAHDGQELLRHVCFEDLPRLQTLNSGVPDELDIIISKATSKNPHERYETAAHFADDLRRFATDRPISARRASMATLAKRWINRHQTGAVAAGIVVIMTMLTSLAAAGVIWNALASEKLERQRAENLLEKSEGLRLTAHAALELPKNPGLSLALAVKASELTSGAEVNAATIAALRANHERKTLMLRGEVEATVEVNSDGRYAVTTLGGRATTAGPGTALVVDLMQGSTVGEIKGSRSISSAVFHPQRTNVLVAESSGFQKPKDALLAFHRSEPAVLWDWQDPTRRVIYAESALAVARREAFSQDGNLLALPCLDNQVALFRTETGERILTFRGHSEQVMLAIISRDGRFAASVDASGKACVWSTTDASLVKSIQAASKFSTLSSLALTSDSNLLVIAGRGGTSIYSVQSDSVEPLQHWQEPRFALSPRYNHIACFWDFGKNVILRDVQTKSAIAEHAFPEGVRTVKYASDGRSLVIAAGDVIEVKNDLFGSVTARLEGHSAMVTDVSVDPSLKTVVSVAIDKTIRSWSVETELERRSFKEQAWGDVPSRFNSAVQENHLATCTAQLPQIYGLQTAEGKLKWISSGQAHRSRVDARALAVFDRQSIRVIDADTSRKIAEVKIAIEGIRDVLVGSTAHAALIVMHSGEAMLWNFDQQRLLSLATLSNPCSAWQMANDGATLAIGTVDGVCSLYSSATGKLLGELDHPAAVRSVEFLEDGQSLMTLDALNMIRRWNRADFQQAQIYSQPGAIFDTVEASKSQNLVVAYHLDRPSTACSWDLESGELIQTWEVGTLKKCALHPTLPALATASLESGVQQWNPIDGTVRKLSSYASVDVVFQNDQLIAAEVGAQARTQKLPIRVEELNDTPSLKVFDVKSGDLVLDIDLLYEPDTISVDPATDTVLVSALAWKIAIGDRDSGTIRYSQTYSAPVSVVCAVPGTGNWAVASNDGRASILARSGESLREFPSGLTPILAGAVSPDSKLFATGDLLGVIRVWEIDGGAEFFTDADIRSSVRSLQFDNTGHMLIVALDNGQLRQIDLRTRASKKLEFADGIQAVHLSADGRWALVIQGRDVWSSASGAPDGVLDAFQANAVTGRALVVDLRDLAIREFEQPPAVIAGAIDSASNQIAVVAADGAVQVIELENLQRVRTIECQPRHVVALAFAAKGTQLATLEDFAVSLWDVATGTPLLEIESNLHKNHFGMMGERNYWQPFVAGESDFVLFNSRIELYPSFPAKVAAATAPRALTAEETRKYQIDKFVVQKLRD